MARSSRTSTSSGTRRPATRRPRSARSARPSCRSRCRNARSAVTSGAAAATTAPLSDFIMSEIDLLKRSSFEWCDIFGDGAALVANGFNAWAGIFFLNGRWYGVAGRQKQASHLIAAGERIVCLAAADDWLNANETDESAHKSRGLAAAAADRSAARVPARRVPHRLRPDPVSGLRAAHLQVQPVRDPLARVRSRRGRGRGGGMMEAQLGTFSIAVSRNALAALASAQRAVCGLPATRPWLRLVRALAHEQATTVGLVLLHHLSALLRRLGQEVDRHG